MAIINVIKDKFTCKIAFEAWKFIDIFCEACGSNSHPWQNCDAKTMKCLEFLKNMDGNQKEKYYAN